MTAGRVRGRASRLALFSFASLTLAVAALQAVAGEPIVVLLDQATVVKLPERVATVVIGNPLIADLSIEPGGIGVLTGKGYGATNVIAMDSSGAVLLDKTVEVRGASGDIVVVYRGPERETYSCTPDCSRRITLGDFPEFFDKTLAQTTTRNMQALAAGAISGR